jgi:excisionase family DNA binding protein
MITIGRERLLNLEEAARLLPPVVAGWATHRSRVLRLIRSGELEGLRIGRQWVTSLEAVQRHAERHTRAALGDDASAHTAGAA